jgi:poly-gamma-glutamate capsule biosynthesis protein CapA/YwtB (metallophosphatase superfamily)
MVVDAGLTVLIVGDVYVQCPEPDSIFSDVVPYLRNKDILFGNLEGLVTNVGDPTAAKQSTKQRSDEKMMTAYISSGFDAMSLANNHGVDYGWDGLKRCIEVLEQAGIAHCGGGANINEARKPAILERKGTKVAFLSYSSVFAPAYAAGSEKGGIATVRVSTTFEPHPRHIEVPGSPPIIHTIPDPKDAAAMEDDVRRAKKAADIVIVSWHWGVSPASGGSGQIVDYQVQLAHRAIDAGADLIAGHHPHTPGAIEVYKGKVIFYSLGNFAYTRVKHAQGTLLVRSRFVENGVQQVSFIPGRINERGQPTLIDTKEGKEVVHDIVNRSTPLGTNFQINAKEVIIRQ